MNACALTASITAIANSLACGLTEDEINRWGRFSPSLETR